MRNCLIYLNQPGIPSWIVHRNGSWCRKQGMRLIGPEIDYPLDEYSRKTIDSAANQSGIVINEGHLSFFYSPSSQDNTFFLTNRCNSNCIMCPSSENSRTIPFNLDPLLIEEEIKCLPPDAGNIVITGGEPFLVTPSLMALLDGLKRFSNDTRYLLLTNGRALCIPEIVAEFLFHKPDHVILGIPVHGSTPEIHDLITQAPGSFAQTWAALRIAKMHNIPLELRIVVSALNLTDITTLADSIVSELSSVNRVVFIGLEMTGNAATNAQRLWVPYSKAFQACKKAIFRLFQQGIDVRLYNFPLCAVEKEFHPLCHRSISTNKIAFAPECQTCSLHPICGGIFRSSIRYAAKDLKVNHEKLLFP